MKPRRHPLRSSLRRFVNSRCFRGSGRTSLLLLAASATLPLLASNARAQAVWSAADDRNNYAGAGIYRDFWSYGYVAPDQNGNNGHAGNWSGSLAPGLGGSTDVYLGAPGGTLCDVNVTLNSLTFAPGGALGMDFSSSLTVTTTDLATDGTVTNGIGGGSYPSYTNTGTMTKTAGTGVFAFAGDITLNSTPGSTIAANSGTLQFPGQSGLFDTVTFNPTVGATINLVGQAASGTFQNYFQNTLSGGTGTGTVLLSGGIMHGSSTVVTTLAFPGAMFQWTGGNLGGYQGHELFTNTGVLNVSGDATKTGYAVFTNLGTVNQTGAGNFFVGGNSTASFTNAAGGVYNLQSDAGVGDGDQPFNNAGLFRKSAGTGTSTITAQFNNQGGTVEVDSGTLQLPIQGVGGNQSTGGTFNVAAGAVLDLGDGQYFSGAYTGGGAGVVRLSQGTLYNGASTATVLNFPGALFQWTGGTIGGNQGRNLFANAGTINLSGDAAKTSYANFTNQGTMIQTGAGDFSVGTYHGAGGFTNEAGAIYNLQSDAGVTTDYFNPFTNAGLFEKTGGTGTSTISALTTNPGTISVYTGTLLFSAPNNSGVTDVSGTTLTEGTWNVYDGATLSFQSYPSITVNQAVVSLSGVNSSFPALRNLADNQGSLSLLALRQFATVGSLANEGTLSLDAGSTMHVGGDFTASGANSMLAVTIGGTARQGSGSPGVLQANGAATLAGNLSLTFAKSAVLPGNSDTLTILSAGSPVAGSFANAASGSRLSTTDGGGSFRVYYGADANTVILTDFLLPGQTDVPTATLSALVPSVVAGSSQDAEFLLTLSPAPTSDVVVNFIIKGSAVNGTDYVLLEATKKIKAGKTSKPIKIIPQGDLGGASKKTVVLTLQPGTGYQVGTTGKVKVKITD